MAEIVTIASIGILMASVQSSNWDTKNEEKLHEELIPRPEQAAVALTAARETKRIFRLNSSQGKEWNAANWTSL